MHAQFRIDTKISLTTLWAQCLQCLPLSNLSYDFQLSESLIFRTLDGYLGLSYFTILCTSITVSVFKFKWWKVRDLL